MTDEDRNTYNSVTTDYEKERGMHPLGKLVHISTVTHAWRGILLDVTPSYYILDPDQNVALVDSTGEIGTYLENPVVAREGDVHKPKADSKRPTVMILRGAVSWMVAF